MTTEEFEEIFVKYDKEFLKFDKIENKLSNRPDLHAFLLLDKLVPGDSDIVSAAEHDQIWLVTDVNKLVEVITEEQIVELVRCGVMIDSDDCGLCMYA